MSQLSQFFNPNQKKDTSYNGPRPYGSLLEAAGGTDYLKNINARLAGQGVGYGDEYANQASNPVIARMRGQFNTRDIPELQSQLSSTGRRRGSAGFDQISQAYNKQGLDEGAIYSGLYQQNEQQKRTEMNQALQDLGSFNQNEYNARNTLSNFEYSNTRNQVADASNQRAEGNAAFGRMIGVSTLGLPVGTPSSVTSPTASGSYAPQYSASQVNQSLQQPSYLKPKALSYNNVSPRLK